MTDVTWIFPSSLPETTRQVGMRAATRFGSRASIVLSRYLSSSPPVPFRLLHFLVASFAKHCPIRLKVVNIYVAYRTARMTWARTSFDAFARDCKLKMQVQIGERLFSTTPAQLNFLQWADETGILTFAERHEKTLRQAMKNPSKGKGRELKATFMT